MRKSKILYKVTKKGAKKLFRRDFKYNEKSIKQLAILSVKYIKSRGVKSFTKRLKGEIIAINKRVGNNLVFPNGLVSGVDKKIIKSWYRVHKKRLTIVIPSYNDLEFLKPCLESIANTTNPEFVKVIVIDDFCEKSNSKKLRELENNQVTIYLRKQNGGFAKACNDGFNLSDKKHDIILLNSDTIAHEGWLEALQYAAYEFGEKVGIVGPKLLYPDGRIQSAGSHRNTEVPEFFDHYYRFQEQNYGPANIPHYCIGVTGACMYIKREFINKVGIFDDNFQFAFEDMDLCVRGWNMGYKSLYFPASTLTHCESAIRPKNKKISEKEKQSIKYFWEKWGDWFDNRNVKNTDGKTKIIFVLQSLGISGGIKIVFEHAIKLASRGFYIEVWGLESSTPWRATDVKIRKFRNYDKLTEELYKEDAIKVATWWETAFPVWLASVKRGIPVYFIQEFETWFYPNDVVAQASVVSCYRKEFINMTTSQYNLNEINNIGLKATAIPCGYDDKTYKVLHKTKRYNDKLLAVGRTFFQKNFDFTFRAWRSLGKKRPKMWLFGIEPEMQKLDSRIKYFKKPSNEEVNKLYNQSTVFVQTSRHEGFSLPILEAMAAGCPVICTDAHGNRDFCFNNKNCLMVKHDDVDQLKTAIDRLMHDSELRSRLSKEALKTVKNYQWDVVMDEVEKFYRKLAK